MDGMSQMGGGVASHSYADYNEQGAPPGNGAHDQMAISHQQLLALLPKLLAQQKPDGGMMMHGMAPVHGSFMPQAPMHAAAQGHGYPQQHVPHAHQQASSPATHEASQVQGMMQGHPPNLFSQINQAMAKYQMPPHNLQQPPMGMQGQPSNVWGAPQPNMLGGMPPGLPAQSPSVLQCHHTSPAASSAPPNRGRRHSDEKSASQAVPGSSITVGSSRSSHGTHHSKSSKSSKSSSSGHSSVPRVKQPVIQDSDDDAGGDSDDEGSRGVLSKDDRKEARREYHKRIERKRRDRMKSLYDTLRELANPQEPADKNTVLQGAVDLIKELQRENAILLASSKRHSTINSSGCSNSSNGGEGSEKRETPGDVSDNSLDSEESGNSNANSSSTNDSCGAKSTSTGSTGSSSREVSTEAIARKPNGDHALTKSNIKRASGMPSKGIRTLSDREGSEGSSEDREREKRPLSKRPKTHHHVAQVHEEAIDQEA